jgi:hypothetical protein
LIARFLPLNWTRLIDALLLSSFPPTNGKKDNTAFCASTADDGPEAHHSENAREYVIGKVAPLRVGLLGAEDVVVAAIKIRFESRLVRSSVFEMLEDFILDLSSERVGSDLAISGCARDVNLKKGRPWR